MTGFVLKSFEGDLGTNPAFVTWLSERMDASVLAGYKVVEEAHKAILAGWATKPSFTAKDILDIGRLYQAREMRVTGPIAWRWWLINDGGSTIAKGPIRNTYMRYEWAGKGASYSAATDTGKPYQKIGNKSVVFDIFNRSIAPRNMIGKVSRDNRDLVFKAMEAAFNG